MVPVGIWWTATGVSLGQLLPELLFTLIKLADASKVLMGDKRMLRDCRASVARIGAWTAYDLVDIVLTEIVVGKHSNGPDVNVVRVYRSTSICTTSPTVGSATSSSRPCSRP